MWWIVMIEFKQHVSRHSFNTPGACTRPPSLQERTQKKNRTQMLRGLLLAEHLQVRKRGKEAGGWENRGGEREDRGEERGMRKG